MDIDHNHQLDQVRGSAMIPPHAGLVRCACQRCGSHVHANVLKQTISGRCRTCGSLDIVSLNSYCAPPRQRPGSGYL